MSQAGRCPVRFQRLRYQLRPRLAAKRWVNRSGAGAFVREETVDAGGCPRRHATAKEVGVFRPDRTADGQGGCENRPIIRITSAEPLSRFGFEAAVEVWADNQSGQVLLRFRVCSFGNEEGNAIGVGIEDASNPLTEHGANQNAGVKYQCPTWLSASSRG